MVVGQCALSLMDMNEDLTEGVAGTMIMTAVSATLTCPAESEYSTKRRTHLGKRYTIVARGIRRPGMCTS